MTKFVIPKHPTATSIKVEHILDEMSDLSYLGEYTESPQGKEEFIIDREQENGSIDSNEYKFFVAENVSNRKEALENYERMESYNNGNWQMIGIKATLTYAIGKPKQKCIHYQELNSSGLWGIESDSDKEYIKSVEQEEIDDVINIAKIMNVIVPQDIKIEREEN